MKAFVNRLARSLQYLALAISFVMSSCSNEHFISITVTPSGAFVTQAGQSTQFRAVGTTNHPNVPAKDLTSTSIWSSSTTSVATITAAGLAT